VRLLLGVLLPLPLLVLVALEVVLVLKVMLQAVLAVPLVLVLVLVLVLKETVLLSYVSNIVVRLLFLPARCNQNTINRSASASMAKRRRSLP